MPWIETYLQKKLGDPVPGDKDWIRYACTQCPKRGKGPDRKRHMYVNINQFRVHCFRCGYSADLFKFVAHLEGRRNLDFETLQQLRKLSISRHIEGKSFQEAVQSLFEDRFRRDERTDPDLLQCDLPDGYDALTDPPDGVYASWAANYLKKRGVSLETAVRRRIGFARSGRYAGYLIFPVTYKGRVVYYTTRIIGAGEPKSLNPEKDEVPYGKGLWLYGYDEVIGAETVTIVEGPLDQIATSAAVAVLGKTMTVDQLLLLASTGARRFRVCLDGEATAEAHAMAARVRGIGPVEVLGLPDGMDPADVRGNLDAHATIISSPESRARHKIGTLTGVRIGPPRHKRL